MDVYTGSVLLLLIAGVQNRRRKQGQRQAVAA